MPDLRLLLASCFGSRVEGHAPAHKEGKAVDIIGVVTSEPHRCAADFFGLPNPSIGNALEQRGAVIGRIPRPHVDRPSNRPRADAGMTGRERDRLASPRTGTGNQRFLSLKQRENAAIWHHRLGKVVIVLRKWHPRRDGLAFQDLHF